MKRRRFIKKSLVVGAASTFLSSACFLAKAKLSISFKVIPDPDGWHDSLKLKGDWIIIAISDGHYTGYGEISHSRNDEMCKLVCTKLFDSYVKEMDLSIKSLDRLMKGPFAKAKNFISATAISGLNQALIELVAKRESVPVWKLFSESPSKKVIPLYTTINRTLKQRTEDEYLETIDKLIDQGFKCFKCAPFEKVTNISNSFDQSKSGINTLSVIRANFPDIRIKVDFHERFDADNFFQMLPLVEDYKLDWLEEPFAPSAKYLELKKKTSTVIAGGELFFGMELFSKLVKSNWVDVIMPDVKHVGGFTTLLDICKGFENNIQVSPHNPSGPVSTAASLHCAALSNNIRELEFPFDSNGSRKDFGEIVKNGEIHLSDEIGWGLDI